MEALSGWSRRCGSGSERWRMEGLAWGDVVECTEGLHMGSIERHQPQKITHISHV